MKDYLLLIVSLFVTSIFFFLIIFIQSRKKKKMVGEFKSVIKNIGESKYEDEVSQEIKDIYKQTTDKLIEKEETIKTTMNELNSYKQELNMTYKSLLGKSTELEYSNNLLEKRVISLSNLNAVGKSVLSELDLDKIISIILDAYFVLTGAKKISLYLWENNKLMNKAFKGNIKIKKELVGDYSNIKGLKNSKYESEYLKIAESIKEENEGAIVSELRVKGKELGVIITVEDLKNGSIDKDEMETISALAIHVAIAINNAQMYKELSRNERIEKEVSIAADIQKKLLPQDIKTVFGLEIANYFEPAKEIGGDYYDYFISAEGKFGVSIGDVSGKGVPAALLMTTIRAILKTISFYNNLPDVALSRLNEIIFEDINDEMFVTLFYSLYDYESRILYYSNAGHNPLIHYDSKKKEISEKNVKGVAVGFLEDYDYKLGQLKLNYGDVLVYYTDGITEAENKTRDMLGIDKLKEVVLENICESAEYIKDRILKLVNDFRGGYEQVDDITLVVIKHKR